MSRRYVSVTGRIIYCSAAQLRRMDLLPYGKWTCWDGREVLFNRFYEPIWQRREGGKAEPADREEWLKWKKQEWFYDDSASEARARIEAELALDMWGGPNTMSRFCRGCHQNVELHSGCSVGRVVVMGATFERVRWSTPRGERCPDCSTIVNGYHHVGCPAEECPVCGRRNCGCVRLTVAPRPLGAEEPYEQEFGGREVVE